MKRDSPSKTRKSHDKLQNHIFYRWWSVENELRIGWPGIPEKREPSKVS